MALLPPDAETTLTELLFEKTPAPLAYFDLDFNFIHVNHIYAVTNGKKDDYFCSKNYFDLFPSDEILKIFNDVVTSGTSYSAKATSFAATNPKIRDTTFFDWNLTIVKNNKGQKVGLLLQLVDVIWKSIVEKQSLNVVQDESPSYAEELEDIIEERTQLLQQTVESLQFENSQRVKTEALMLKAKEEAEKANIIKSQFLSRMSHELRTPMNAILGFSQLLRRHDLNEKQESLNDEILSAGRHLLSMISDILDLAVIEEGHISLSISEVPLYCLIEESISLVKHKLDFRNITIHNLVSEEDNITIRVDATRIKEVMVNLLTNAVKYNSDNGLVSIGYKVHDNSLVRIYVSDTGKGLTEENQTKIFEPFNRLGAEYSDIEGVGIGLSISKKLMDVMDGSIRVESKKGHGSTFYLECPIGKRVEVNIGNHANSTLDNRDSEYNILYVEDNKSNQRLVKTFLQEYPNIHLTIASTAEEGLNKISEDSFDLIILDINLPGMDGYGALEILNIDAATKDIPVIALSAAASTDDIKKGLEAGFNQYITKPVVLPELISIINNELNRIT